MSALAKAGRLDGWRTVLVDGATRGIEIASADALVSADGRTAWSTAVEYPVGGAGTLLCTQRWVNAATGEQGAAADGSAGAQPPEWRLAQHRTIPWVADQDAAAALRCDRRGCCVLQRAGTTGPAGMPGDGKA